MAEIITREQQVLFFNSTKIKGVQSVNFQYDLSNSTLKGLGSYSSSNDVSQQVGQLTVNVLAVTQDQIIPFTGDLGLNGYLLKNKNNSAENYSFLSGFLTNYRSSCSVGEIPQISANFEVYGNIGRIAPSESSDFSSIASSQDLPLSQTSYQDFSLTINDFNVNRIISYDININVGRRPDYIIGSRIPTRVSLNWPIEIEASFVISAAEYDAYNIRKFPHNTRTTDISLTFKNSRISSSNILSYSFSDMTFVSESYSTDVDGKSTVTLNYKGFLDKPSLVLDGLVFYINPSNRNSYRDPYSTVEDLTFNNYNLILEYNSLSDARMIKLDGINAFGMTSKQHKMSNQFTFCIWLCYFSLTGYRAIVSWGETGEHEIQLNYETVSGPFALSLHNHSAFFNLGEADGASNWTFLTVTFDQSSKVVRSYINGVLNTTASTVGYDFTSNQGEIYLGASSLSSLLEANINKILLYNRVLTDSEILSLYNFTRSDVVDLPTT